MDFTSKGRTLEALARRLTHGRILPLRLFTVRDFHKNPSEIAGGIQAAFADDLLIVRSSARNEDTMEQSGAGRFKSVPNVPRADRRKLEEAIREVIESYDRDGADDNEVLVQPQLTGMAISGVVLTADPDTLAPYDIVNYDTSGRSDTITGGRRGETKTLIRFKEAPDPPADSRLAGLFAACRELERITDCPFLDIEFAVEATGSVIILQCRPIVTANKENLSQLNLKDSLLKIHKKIVKLSSPHPNLLGEIALFGVMPDWNPAEIIGLRPRQLSLTLYKELVTDNIWAYQRDNYGYRNLRSHPLLVSILGVPYVDVRVDFNSFIPKRLNEKIAAKLASHYLRKLTESPHQHDKVEFEIVHSCYYLNLHDRLMNLRDGGFSENEIGTIEHALRELTNDVIDPERGLYKNDLKKIDVLGGKYRAIMTSHLSIVDKIYWLIEDCKRYGTLPFAGIARAAFIGVQFLKSIVEMGIVTPGEHARLMNSLNTVAKRINHALGRLARGETSRDDFLREFGHLRPKSYDILSPRYDEDFDSYFPTLRETGSESTAFSFNREQTARIDNALGENGLNCRAFDLAAFVVAAVEGREYAKFVFSKSLSEVLRLLIELGVKCGITRDDLSHVDIRTVLNLYSSLDHRDVRDILLSDIGKNRELHRYTKAVKLPALIRRAADVYEFLLEKETPNYITLKSVSAPVAREEEIVDESVTGRIVFIRSADPGYDFLFTRDIAGLVTQFGGANSHMAIRCAECAIPAVIGAGEKNYNEWSKSRMLEIDCLNKQVRILS